MKAGNCDRIMVGRLRRVDVVLGLASRSAGVARTLAQRLAELAAPH